jgi:hypothetical protein
MQPIMYPLCNHLCDHPLCFAYMITFSVTSATTHATILDLTTFPKCSIHPMKSEPSLSKVCTTCLTLTFVRKKTDRVNTQTIFAIKSATSYAMNSMMSSGITHPVQVLCFTTNYALGWHKVCDHLKLPIKPSTEPMF